MTYALAIAPLAKMNPTIMKTTFRFGLPCQIAGLLVLLCSLAVTDGRAADKVTLRESLARVYQLYPKTKDMVLISHSMGGLLSQMQAVTTRRVLWDDVFQSDADRLYAKVPADHAVKRRSEER